VTQVLEAGAWEQFKAMGWELNTLIQPSPNALKDALAKSDALVSMLTDRLSAEVLQAAQAAKAAKASEGGRLKIIANHAVGYDNIDVQAAHNQGIVVTNTPGVLTQATAEFALTLILNLLRRVSEGEALLRSGQWQGWEPTQLLGSSLAGKKVGILGAGRIGQALGQLVHLLGAKVAYCSRSPQPAFESQTQAKQLDFQSLLKWSEVLSLHLPGGADTFHLLNAETLAMLPKGAILINTGRGTSIDEVALAEALQSGHLGGAALDVYEKEPSVHPALLSCPNTLLLPHLGSATVSTRRAMALTCLQNIQAVFAGQPAPNQIPI
jgi:lactate dehydrogenase-like 2-hydroxyacid dehydrogenase